MIDKAPEGGQWSAVVALAGRRTDALDAEVKRFPLDRVPIVKNEILELFKNEAVGILVCSAACGADLLALDSAISLGVRCRVILPYNTKKFRETSVVDRPGEWGPLFDRVIADVQAKGDLIILGGSPEGDQAFSYATRAIVQEAANAAGMDRATSVLVWEGSPHGKKDATAEFRQLALNAGMKEVTVLTCAN